MSLGLLFLRRTDRQGWFRIFVTIFSITLATVILFSAIAMGEGMIRSENRGQYLEIPHDNSYRSDKKVDENADELVMRRYYNYSLAKASPITEIGMRQLTPNAPLFPGMTKAPAENEVFVSPALMDLTEKEPEYKDYFGDLKIIENVPSEILPSPDSLVALSYLPQGALDNNDSLSMAFLTQEQMDNYKPTVNEKIDTIIKVFMLICGLGLTFPLLVLIVSATRIGVLQRQRRYAALSLIGTSKSQINRILIAEALAAGVSGIVLGIGLYEIARHTLLTKMAFANNSGRYFPEDITVAPMAFFGVVALILLLIAVINWWAMCKVKTSPLGVMYKQKLRQKPGIWRLLPLVGAIGVLYYVKYGLGGVKWVMQHTGTFTMMIPAIFVLMMLGLLLAGSYVTYLFALIFNKLARRSVSVMSSKRLKIFPKTIFSSVSGVVLAIFVGSFLITSIETVKLTTYKLFDADIETFYKENGTLDFTIEFSSYTAIGTMDLAQLNGELVKNNELKTLVQEISQDAIENPDGSVSDHLSYHFKNSADLEKAEILISNYLANYARRTGDQIGFSITNKSTVPSYLFDNFKNLIDAIYVGTIVTILIGGLSLATTTIGGFFERKFSFANLRLMGVNMKTLNRVVLVESIIPLLLAGAGALIAGIWLSWAVLGFMVNHLYIALPEPSYFISLGGAFVASILIIISILPILKQITGAEETRTE